MAATTKQSEAKNAFRNLLIKHKGDANHVDVKETLDSLVQLAAEERGDNIGEWSPTQSMVLNQGRWRSITTPPFPGKLPEDADGKSKFTLGRMSFGMFKPTKLVCAVEDIVNVVEPVEKEGGHEWTQSYTLEVLVEIEISSTKIPAKLINYGVCFPQSPTRLGVKFTGGTLQPGFEMSGSENAALSALWEDIFDNAIAKEADTQSYLGQVGTWASHKLMKMMMELEPPIEVDADFTQTYKIGKPFVGHLDIIYLDEDFRVTKGNKGTIVVVERLAEEDKE